MKVIIKGVPPTINNYIGKTDYHKYQEDKKKYSQSVIMQTIGFNPNIEECKMKITYYFKDNRRRDPGNYEKILLDALIDAHIIKDDNYSVITELTTKAKVDSNNPRVEIDIEPIRYDLCMKHSNCKGCPKNAYCEEEISK